MSQINLAGMGVALVTPFKADKTIDFESLGNLIEYQIDNGADYFVVLGTTAETPTLSDVERHRIKEFVAERVAGRRPLVLGMGGNNTMALVEEMKVTDMTGYSAILSVVPFYNKPSQEGIYRHYAALAEVTPIPMVLYNVPSRTGVNMTSETTLRLAREYDNIVGIKEASGNIEQAGEIVNNKPDRFILLSGDDAMTYRLLAMGARGVVSVIGNAFPREFSMMVSLELEGMYRQAEEIHNRFAELFKLLFVDGNPAGVKCLLHAMGMIENELRLPLVPTCMSTNDSIERVFREMTARR